jgi:hypothetical protein
MALQMKAEISHLTTASVTDLKVALVLCWHGVEKIMVKV